MVRPAQYLYTHFGLPGAGLIFMLEGLGVPIPVEIPLGIVGLRIVEGLNGYWEIVLLMWGTTVVGNTIGYMTGYYGGRPVALRFLSWFRVNPETWGRMERWFHQHGMKMVIATRWINWGFAQNMWLCGITRMDFRRFFIVMVVNDFLWAMGWTWIAYMAMRYFRRGMKVLHISTMKLGLFALLVLLVGLLIWLLVRRRNTNPRKDETNA